MRTAFLRLCLVLSLAYWAGVVACIWISHDLQMTGYLLGGGFLAFLLFAGVGWAISALLPRPR